MYQAGKVSIAECSQCGEEATVIKHETKEQFLRYGKIQVIKYDLQGALNNG